MVAFQGRSCHHDIPPSLAGFGLGAVMGKEVDVGQRRDSVSGDFEGRGRDRGHLRERISSEGRSVM